ncbi:DUF6107 family protein [Rhizobium sp. IBUN]|uniref:DUF6107 family protein n=1 Tax=Rhizobium sp. IBUN TaxID=1042326 RepID=UPI001FD9FF58|nr:DUF6107 family protein [Rhizobium sp. IBUN]
MRDDLRRPTGIWIVERLALADRLSASEVVLSGSAAAGLCAWWVSASYRASPDDTARAGASRNNSFQRGEYHDRKPRAGAITHGRGYAQVRQSGAEGAEARRQILRLCQRLWRSRSRQGCHRARRLPQVAG